MNVVVKAKTLSQRQRRFLLALARRVVPESEGMDPQAQSKFLSIIETALASRPSAMRRQVGLFLAILRWLPALRYGVPLDRLTSDRQDAALRWFQGFPVALVRKGFWGIKAMIFMGYYGRPEVGEQLHYVPSRTGNQLLPASPLASAASLRDGDSSDDRQRV